MRRCVFLDRDGVINAMVYDENHGVMDSPFAPESLRLLDGAREGIAKLRELGYLILVVTNQPGMSKGTLTEKRLTSVHARMDELLGDAKPDAVYFCPHHPEYSGDCECRKPKPGLLLQAAAEWDVDLKDSFMVGDGLTDILAGRTAGCKTILLSRIKCDICRKMEELQAYPDGYADTWEDVVKFVEGERLL